MGLVQTNWFVTRVVANHLLSEESLHQIHAAHGNPLRNPTQFPLIAVQCGNL